MQGRAWLRLWECYSEIARWVYAEGDVCDGPRFLLNRALACLDSGVDVWHVRRGLYLKAQVMHVTGFFSDRDSAAKGFLDIENVARGYKT